MRFFLYSVLVIVAGCVGVNNAPSSDTSEQALPRSLPADLERVLRDYERAWRAKDAAALAELFTEDGFVLESNHPPVQGRAAIKTAYTGAGGPLSLRELSFATHGNVGYIIGVYGHDANAPEAGKFILALRLGADGRWMITADIDNSSQPRAD